MYKDISHNPQKTYTITKPGVHVFYFENMSQDIHFIVTHPDANVQIYGLYRGKETQKFHLAITQTHTVPGATSTALIKSVLDDASQLHITGKIHIAKNAVHTKAFFTNKNLLLNKNASVTTAPQLEVFPHDVTCTHAAVTTPIDTDQLHYIATRGIAQKDAQDLLINGFTQDVLRHKKI